MTKQQETAELIDILDNLESSLSYKDIYVGFNGHGHLKYIQATKAGLLKLGIFFIKSSFSETKFIDIQSDEKQLDWIDPESKEPIDYIELIDDIEKTINSRNVTRQLGKSTKTLQIWTGIIILLVLAISLLTLTIIGLGTVLNWLIK